MPRVSNHEAMGRAVMVPWNMLQYSPKFAPAQTVSARSALPFN